MEITDNITPELERIRQELEKLSSMQIHIGIQGTPGYGAEGKSVEGAPADLLTIAGVHEFGATIKPKNVRNLAIPINKAAIGKSPKDFDGLFFIRSEEGYLFGCISPKKRGEGPKRKTSPSEKEPDKKKPRQKYQKPEQEDVTFLFLLLQSVNIPERSFIRAGYDSNKNELGKACIEALEGIVMDGWDAETAANHIGMRAVNCIQTYMNTASNFKGKGAITKETSNWPNSPLIETGRLRNSITYRIEE